MNTYIVCRSYLYGVEADSPEEARELFEEYMENGDLFIHDPRTGVSFGEIVTTVENEAGEIL